MLLFALPRRGADANQMSACGSIVSFTKLKDFAYADRPEAGPNTALIQSFPTVLPSMTGRPLRYVPGLGLVSVPPH